MKKGYIILNTGERIKIELGYTYGTYDVLVDATTTPIYVGEELVRIRLESNGFGLAATYYETTIHFESSSHPLIIKKMVLPKGITELHISHDISVLEPVWIPNTIKELTIMSTVTISNLDEFINRDDTIIELTVPWL